MYRHNIFKAIAASAAIMLAGSGAMAQTYTPTPEVKKVAGGIFGRQVRHFHPLGHLQHVRAGEWYLNNNINAKGYAKAARGFYPADFDAREWVEAIKNSGARYITFTTRHHDGFSMWHTGQSPYNIVDATPFGRDILKELADECHRQG